MTSPREADGSLRADRSGSVATSPSRTAEGLCWVSLPDGRKLKSLEHLALDWLDADAAPGEARLVGRQQRLVEQTADAELVARLLAEPGVDPNAAASVSDGHGDVDPYTPLTRAAELGHLEAVRLLLEAGADPTASDYHGQNSVHKASLSGNASAIRLLARHKRGGAAASALDYFQRSPRALSLMNGHKECADMLVDTSAGGSKYIWRGNKTYCKIVMLSRFLCCPSR